MPQAPQLKFPQRITKWQQLSPACRLLCCGLGVFAIALTPNGQWWSWFVYGVAVVGLGLWSRVDGRRLAQRLAVESLFVSVVVIGALFRSGGDLVWAWGIIRITTQGLVVMGSVAIKMVLSLLLLNILTLTTSVAELLQGLQALRVSPMLVAVLAAMYRYLGLLVQEFQTMQRAAQARNLMGTAGTIRLVVSHIIGSLFIRTVERGERIHRAMVSRAYTPELAGLDLPKTTLGLVITTPLRPPLLGHWQEWGLVTLTGMIAVVGQVIYLAWV